MQQTVNMMSQAAIRLAEGTGTAKAVFYLSNQRAACCEVKESANAPRYTFSTKEYLSEAGLYLYQYRVYDPIAGRWTQRDPIDYQDSINLYQFCGNNPVNLTDIDGKISEIINADLIPDEFTDIKNAAIQEQSAGREMLVEFMKLLLIDVPLAMCDPAQGMVNDVINTMIDHAPLNEEQKIQAKVAYSMLTARAAGKAPIPAVKDTVKESGVKAVTVTADALVEKGANTPSETTQETQQNDRVP